MMKFLTRKSNKIQSALLIFSLFVQNLTPILFLAPAAKAQEPVSVDKISLEYDESTNEFKISGTSSEETEFVLTYEDSDPETESIHNAMGTVQPNGDAQFDKVIDGGTCSGEDCVEHEVSSGTLSFPEANYEADFTIRNGQLWLQEGSRQIVSQVELGVTYIAPQNDQVRLTFTRLPENPGSLMIEEIQLTEQQVTELNAVSNIAYDITSSMPDGSFEYSLTLPHPELTTQPTKLLYAENINELDEAKELEKNIEGNLVTVDSLDHFTVFIVTFEDPQNPTPSTPGYNDVWFDFPSVINQVPSGTNGIPSSDGDFHAEISGPAFTRWGGYSSIFPTFGYDTMIDVYLDMNLADGSSDKRFDFSSAINNPTGTHRRDFIIHLGTNPTLAGQWLVSTSNNAPGWPGNPGRNPANITETGWYTIKHEFRENSSGELEVTISISKKGESSPIGSWVLSDPSDIVGTTVGGNRYGWFTNQRFDFAWLAVDNTRIETFFDTEGPTAPTILFPAEGQYFKTAPILNDWTDATDPSGIQKYRVQYEYDDGHTFSGYPYRETTASERNHSPGISEQGGVKFRVQAFDTLGNEGAWSEWRHYFYDATPPAIPTLTSPANDAVVKGNPQQKWSKPTGAVQFKYESYSDAGLTDLLYQTTTVHPQRTVGGNQTITIWWRVKAIDAAGNESDWTPAWKLTVDNTPPTSPNLISPDNNAVVNGASLTNDWSDVSDAVKYIYHSYHNEEATNLRWSQETTASQKTATNVANATFWWKVKAVDLAGNESSWSDLWKVTIDNAAPTTTLTSPADDTVSNQPITIAGSSSDLHGIDSLNLYYSLAGEENWQLITTLTHDGTSPFTFSYDWTPPSDNTYDIKAAATDTVGNVETSAYARDIIYDTTKPTSEITTFDLEDGDTIETPEFSGLIEGTAADTLSGVQKVFLTVSYLAFGADPSETVYWDHATSAWISTETEFEAAVVTSPTTTWSYTLPDVPNGIYEIASRALDQAGNKENTYTVGVIFDNTIPEVNLTINPATPDGLNNYYRSVKPTITLTASDNYTLDKIQYQWNSTSDAGWVTYSTPITPPSEGQNILYYRSIDTVGNISELGTKTVRYDLTAPAGAPINLKIENVTGTTADGSWTKPDNDSDVDKYEIRWRHENGTEFGTETGRDDFSHQLDRLFNGLWTFYVKAVDPAGNFKEASIEFRVGPGPAGDGGAVLGASTQTPSNSSGLVLGSGTGGFLSQNQATDSELEDSTTDSTEENTDQSQAAETGASTDVLGASTCNDVYNYLPILMLLGQLLLLLAVGVILTESGAIKTAVNAIITIGVVPLYYLLRNTECFTQGSMLEIVNTWFIGLVIIVAILAKFLNSMLFGEK